MKKEFLIFAMVLCFFSSCSNNEGEKKECPSSRFSPVPGGENGCAEDMDY